MGKKVKVTTEYRETFYYDHNQEVKTVEIVEALQFRKMGVYKKIGEMMKEVCTDGPCTSTYEKPCPLNIIDSNTKCVFTLYKDSVAYGEDS